jgi:eukaryotic-like serine/threonine-protein kinase
VERPATSDRTDIALGGEVLPPGAEPLRAGDPPVIDGHRLTGRLASGGTSVVYLARGPEGEPVALKTTRARKADQAQARRWLRTEAACSRRVPPSCTAPLLVDGSHHTPPYLISEYVDGPSLGQYVEFLGPLDADQLRALAFALARAIAAVHGAGLIHCDLKPGNVLLAADGPRVIDFSIAQEPPISGRPAGPGTVPYSPGWVAPERLGGRPAEPATDVFGWGCLIGFAATGRSPFDGDDVGTGRWSVARSADLATIEERLRGLVEAALAIDPADRPSIGEITARLGGPGGARATDMAPPPRREPKALAARSSVDEPTAPIARVALEPAREPEQERAYEPAPEAAFGAPHEPVRESPHQPPAPLPAAVPVPALAPADEAPPHRAGRAAAYAAGHDRTAYVPGFGREAPAEHPAGSPPAAFEPGEERRPRRSRRLRAVAMVTAPAALVAVLATFIAMAGTGTSTRAPATPAGGAPTVDQEQDPASVGSPSAVQPHLRSYGPRPASASSARDGSSPPVAARGQVGGQTSPTSPDHSHRPGSPPVSSASPTPSHTPSPSPTPSPTDTGSGAPPNGTSRTGTTPTG